MTDTTTYASVYIMNHNRDKYDYDSYIKLFLSSTLTNFYQTNRQWVRNVKIFDYTKKHWMALILIDVTSLLFAVNGIASKKNKHR